MVLISKVLKNKKYIIFLNHLGVEEIAQVLRALVAPTDN